jgi:acetyl-CoA acyltransferase
MSSAVIVDAVRSPLGKSGGGLSGWHPVDLAAEVLGALATRSGLDPALIDDVIMGCVTQAGGQSNNIARWAVLAAGWPDSVPATTVDRQCGSSQQAFHFAVQGVMSGAYDVVVAAGVESMSSTPMFSASLTPDLPFGPAARQRYAQVESLGSKGLVGQGISAEMIARRWKLDRAALDGYAVRSHELAADARDTGRFAREIVPVAERRIDPDTGEVLVSGATMCHDEGIRESTVESLARLRSAFVEDGCITAGNSSQISDGAAAALIMSEERAATLGLRPRARFVSGVVVGDDPIMMLTAPIPATAKLLQRANHTIDDIDAVEINEAFSSVVLAWLAESGADPDRVNACGGALALGHPLGASGVRLMTTLLNRLESTGGRFGLQTMCEGGGMANAMLIERLG